MPVAAAVPAVIIVQRQTVEWKKLSDAEFYLQSQAFCELWGKPKDYVWQLFQLWNQTFAIDYRHVRQELKELSLDNLRNTKNVLFVPYAGYLNIPERKGYYLFLDDDDWIDPDVSIHLGKNIDVSEGYPELLLWRSANIGSPQQEHVVFVWGMNGRCMTNNYAVHDSWLKPFSKINQILQHKDAAVVFKNHEDVPHLDCALTVSNKSPISSVSLERGLGGDLTSANLVSLVESYLERMYRVQDIELIYMPWSKQYIKNTLKIFERVLQSKR